MNSLNCFSRILVAVLFLAGPLAASRRYFPLDVGNQWVLETRGPNRSTLNIEVLRSRTTEDHTYYFVTGYASGDMWLRVTPEGVVYSWDPATGRETKQAHTALNAAPYSSGLSGCGQAVRRGEVLIFPGSTPPLPLQYDQGGCRSFHFREEIYRWDVGLSQRTVAEADGTTKTYRLVYARLKDRVVTGDDGTLVILSDFNLGARGWLAGFSDYYPFFGEGDMAAEVALLPAEVDDSRTGFRLQSVNGYGADYFMFLKRRLGEADGLEPNQQYELSFDFVLDSNARADCETGGFAPGNSVFLKAGASAGEPLPVPNEEERLVMNIDKGSGGDGGADAGVVRSIETDQRCTELPSPYARLTASYTHPQPVQTDGRGVLWLLAGTDSGAEGLTALFYESIVARLKPVR
ncbi:MAG: hypothetical protein HXY18_15345 [Bryobacteraceae bacterium]|nr:hypothetical protein [Bryobacteraceae bacterium]